MTSVQILFRGALLPGLIIVLFSGLLAGQSDEDWRRKVDNSLLEKSSGETNRPFFVLFRQQANLQLAAQLRTKEEKAHYVYEVLRETARSTQGDVIRFLQQSGAEYKSLFIINAIMTQGSLDLIRELAVRNDVSYICNNPPMRFDTPVEWSMTNVGQRGAIEWGISMIQADVVWSLGHRGQGVVVGGQDTGYEWDHPALKLQYRGYNAIADTVIHDYHWHDAIHEISPFHTDTVNPCGLDSRVPCDDHSHGTHTMGTMIGLDGENEIGVAPEAKWCACRNMERGWGTPFTYLECFQWFLAPTDLDGLHPDPSLAPHVINNSWSCPEAEGCDSTNWHMMDMAINHLRMAGTVVVVSAGNSGSACSTVSAPPAMYEGGFAVGATAINDTIAGFSSRGPVTVDGSYRLKPNVAAPGVWVRSARPGGAYSHASGTSMAGPHVAGLVALIISANPELAGKVDVIEHIIESTAIPKTTDQDCGLIPGSEVPNHTYGHGRVDALAAVQAAIALIPVNTEGTQPGTTIKLYPNPVRDLWTIDTRGIAGHIRLVIYDVYGRLSYHQQWEWSAGSILKTDLSSLHPGIYYFQLQAGEIQQQGRLLKK